MINSLSLLIIKFGVPQWSILGPVFFNIYVSDLQDQINAKCYQYADDTSLYRHRKVSDLDNCQTTMTNAMYNMGLALNSLKTKLMLFSTAQLARVHNLDCTPLDVSVNHIEIERVHSHKLLEIHFTGHLNWYKHVNSISASSYSTIAVLRKLKTYGPIPSSQGSCWITYSIETGLRRHCVLLSEYLRIKASAEISIHCCQHCSRAPC